MEFTIREATHDDAVKVINLLNDVFSAQQRSASNRDENYFDWKFERSPFNKSILTVCEYDDTIVEFSKMDKSELDAMGNRGRKYAEENMNIDKLAEKLLQFIDKV